MSNVVKFSITGDTNAEQVAGRAKTAVSNLDKQLDGIAKKFGSSFKDIFLSFLGPMALLGTAMGFIGKMIADNQKKQEDANQAAIDGTNKLMSAEDKYWANKRNNEKKAKETSEQAKIERRNVTNEFLQNDPRGQKIFDQALVQQTFGHPFRETRKGGIASDPEVQAKVQALIAEDMKANPSGPDISGLPKSFSGPQGFSNVVGVGPDAVMQAQLDQLEELRKQTMLLERLAGASGYTPKDFTKGINNTASPSRSYLLTK
jgi:hypothetical protein